MLPSERVETSPGRRSVVLTNIDGAIQVGLSVSPDRTAILFSKTVRSGANLMMIENFR
ncbi:hypothetical protein SBA6_480034 [Candidatus Sulfopaludibacter sp. SbA6]|nr:hypothetical protein SBA6_480034 [Candidatus Sulfopaludibacter sp. SbA6]